MTLLQYMIAYPDDPLTLAFKGAIERAIKEERIAKTLKWWTPL